MKNKKRVIIYITSTILILSIALMLVELPTSKKKDYQLNIDIESNDNITNPINYSDVITKVREEYNNNDIKGILEIENTDYIVPILQGEDNEYYLNHLPNKEENFMGSVFLDYRVNIDSSRKLLIYGHNSANVDMPFTILEEFYDKDYYDNHKYMSITTSSTKKEYEIFSVYVETSDFSYMNINFDSDEDYYNHLSKLKSKSMYDTGVNINSNDEILVLQTCSEHPDYRNYQKKYLLIILRRL